MRRLLFAPALCFPLCPARAADLFVGPTGSGAAYQSIQDAVDAAAPGDRVLVLPGEYLEAVFLDKPLQLVGSGSAVTRIRSIATFAPGIVPPPLVVADLPAGGRIRVTGFEASTVGLIAFPMTFQVKVRDCAGRVELSDLLILQGSAPPPPQGTLAGFLYIENSGQVVATGVRNTASGTTPFFPFPGGASPADGLCGAVVAGSSVWLGECEFQGAARNAVTSGFGGNGGHGLLAVDSTVHAGRSSFRGGQSGGLQNGVPASGGSGISAAGTDLLVHGGSGNAIEGADALEMTGLVVALGTAGSAIVVDGTSALVYAADVVLAPGAPSATLPGGQAVDAAPGASVTGLAERRPTLAIDPVVAPLGAPVTIEIEGEPGTVHVRALSLATGPAISIPGVSGALLLDLGAFFAVPPIVLGPTGGAVFVSPIPADPALAGVSVVEQSAQVGPSGLSLGPPALLSLGF